jgi:hypothetical protein
MRTYRLMSKAVFIFGIATSFGCLEDMIGINILLLIIFPFPFAERGITVEYLQSMPFYYKLLAVSVCIIVVAVILYFVPGGRIRIPATVLCSLACLFAGIGLGVIGMDSFGFHWERAPTPPILRSPFGGGGGPGGGGAGGGESKKGGEGAGKKGDDKKGDGPNAKERSEKKKRPQNLDDE